MASIQDPRVERTRLHQLCDILTIAMEAVLAGGNGWEDMEIYGVSKQAWLATFLALPHGIQACGYFSTRVPCGLTQNNLSSALSNGCNTW